MLFPLPLTLAPRMIAVLATHKLLVETECNFTFIWICLSSFWEDSSYQAAITGGPFFHHLPKWYVHLRCIRTELLILCWSPSPGWWLIITRVITFSCRESRPKPSLSTITEWGVDPKPLIYLLLLGDSNDPTMLQICGSDPLLVYSLHIISIRPTKYVKMNWWKPPNWKSTHPQEMLDS